MLVLPVFLVALATCQCNTEFSKRVRDFSVELLYYAVEETHWHTVISPLGIWSLLTAVSIGATGSTRDQLLYTLNLPKKRGTGVRKYKKFIESVILPTSPDIKLKCNNFLFLDTGFTSEREFEQRIVGDFGAKVTRIDFKSSKKAADHANSVIEKSDMSISNVFQPDDFNDGRMILTNTISFKGHWKFPFDASNTRVQDFYDGTGKLIGKVNMMQQEGNFQYLNLKTISASVLELPYGDTNKYSILAVLPYADVKLTNVYQGFISLNLKDILNEMKEDTDEYDLPHVVVNLPRFKISTNIVLNTPFINMGLEDMFNPLKAKFNRISKKEKLYVSAVVHKADVEVTETGTIASAATSAFFVNRSLPSKFIANRPFLYFVIEKSTATIIFSGAYSRPTIY